MAMGTVAVVTDLIFSTKIVGTAEQVGVPARTVCSLVELQAALKGGGVGLVVVDMSLPRDVSVACLERAAAHRPPPVTCAFFSHVDGGLKQAAKQAGATLVLPRSEFVTRLPDLLRECGGTVEARSAPPRSAQRTLPGGEDVAAGEEGQS